MAKRTREDIPDETRERFCRWTNEVGVREAAAEVRRRGCDVDDSYFSHMRAGRRAPGLRLAIAIERASAGWAFGPITAREWVRLEPEAASAA